MRNLCFKVQDNGTLTDGARKTCANIISEFAGKIITISIGEKKDKRSLSQNDYYRGVVLPHVKRTMLEEGDARSLDDWHEVLLLSFAPLVNTKAFNGDNIMLPQRTRTMNVGTMAKFITAIIAEMASRGYPVPTSDY